MTFQQLQVAVSPDDHAKASHEYQGVYLSGDELELLEASEKELDKLWAQIED